MHPDKKFSTICICSQDPEKKEEEKNEYFEVQIKIWIKIPSEILFSISYAPQALRTFVHT